MRVMDFLGKLAILLLVTIVVQGIFSLGAAFDFNNYNWVGYVAQICMLMLCIRGAMLDWSERGETQTDQDYINYMNNNGL